MDGSDRLALASPVFVPNGFEDDASADGQYDAGYGLVKKVLKSSRERDSARRKLDSASGPRIMASSMGGVGEPRLSIR